MMTLGKRLTETEQRLFDVLSDGFVHSIPELLRTCMDDDGFLKTSNILPHISNLRRKIDSQGLVISHVMVNGRGYQMTRRIVRDE